MRIDTGNVTVNCFPHNFYHFFTGLDSATELAQVYSGVDFVRTHRYSIVNYIFVITLIAIS